MVVKKFAVVGKKLITRVWGESATTVIFSSWSCTWRRTVLEPGNNNGELQREKHSLIQEMRESFRI